MATVSGIGTTILDSVRLADEVGRVGGVRLRGGALSLGRPRPVGMEQSACAIGGINEGRVAGGRTTPWAAMGLYCWGITETASRGWSDGQSPPLRMALPMIGPMFRSGDHTCGYAVVPGESEWSDWRGTAGLSQRARSIGLRGQAKTPAGAGSVCGAHATVPSAWINTERSPASRAQAVDLCQPGTNMRGGRCPVGQMSRHGSIAPRPQVGLPGVMSGFANWVFARARGDELGEGGGTDGP